MTIVVIAMTMMKNRPMISLSVTFVSILPVNRSLPFVVTCFGMFSSPFVAKAFVFGCLFFSVHVFRFSVVCCIDLS